MLYDPALKAYHSNMPGPELSKKRFFQRIRQSVYAAAAWACCASTAFAQRPTSVPGEDKGLMQWLVAVVLVGLVVATAFMNPKRTHQT